MSTIKTTYIQHPSATSPNLELAADGTVVLPLSDLEDLANVSGSPTDQQVLTYDSGCDWTQVSDSPLTASKKQAWAGYRQTLRDISQTQDDPDSVVWPETP